MRFGRKKTFIEKGMEYAEQALAATESAIADAREKAGPVLSDARDNAVDKAAGARDKAAPLMASAAVAASNARDNAGPMLADARERAAERASSGRDLASAKIARLKGEPEPKKTGFLTKLLVIGGLGALGAFVAKKLQSQQESNWQSSYVPTPPAEPAGGPKVAAVPADDTAGSDPAESLSDVTDTPHAATTPDNPVETVEVKGDPLSDPLPDDRR